MSFVLYADKNRLTVQDREPITSGSVHAYSVRFGFSGDWDGMDKIACFRSGAQIISVALDDSGECDIPWEVMDPDDKGKKLFAGVYGTCGGDVVLPTTWACLGEILEGVSFGQNARPPAPNLWEQQLPRPMTAEQLQNILNGGSINEQPANNP